MSIEFMDKFDALRQISQLKLTTILSSISSPIDLIIENNLMKPLEHFIGVRALKNHGVEKIFKLDHKEMTLNSQSVVYLVRGDLITVKRVCDQISALVGEKKYHLIIVPQSFFSVKTLVEEEGLYGKVQFHSFGWELLHLDKKILSLEIVDVFKCFFAAKDLTYSLAVAKSLWSFQHIFGQPRFKVFLGQYSKSIEGLIQTLNTAKGAPEAHSEIDLLLVFDRDVDFCSVLLTPGTYTSLVDDVLGVATGSVCIPPKEGEKSTSIILSSDDDTYNQIKHRHFSDVGPYLKNRIVEFNQIQSKRGSMSVAELRNFVKNDLKKVADLGVVLGNHLRICEAITKKMGDFFETIQTCQHDILLGENRRECIATIIDLITDEFDFHIVLRLICLLCLSQGGFTDGEASSLKSHFFHSYGYEHLATFYNLEKLGLFSLKVPSRLTDKVVSLARKTQFSSVAAKLKLFPVLGADYSVKSPRDPGYVFGGIYIPIIAQIVRMILKKEKPIAELIKTVQKDSDEASFTLGSDDNIDVQPKCIFVFIVGGITFAEIAALNYVEKEFGCRIVCSGTNMLNGNSLIQSAVPVGT